MLICVKKVKVAEPKIFSIIVFLQKSDNLTVILYNFYCEISFTINLSYENNISQ